MRSSVHASFGLGAILAFLAAIAAWRIPPPARKTDPSRPLHAGGAKEY
jgi:hypothetical protein